VPDGPHSFDARRAAGLLFAGLLALNLVMAPALHRKHCMGACCPTHQGVFGTPQEHGGCCDGAGGHKGSKDDGGCNCLGDCCSIVGHGVTPTVVCDTAPPAPAPTPAPVADPEAGPRAPDAWLLPYPTGPPAAA
jgi:hypothetical protein